MKGLIGKQGGRWKLPKLGSEWSLKIFHSTKIAFDKSPIASKSTIDKSMLKIIGRQSTQNELKCPKNVNFSWLAGMCNDALDWTFGFKWF